MLVKQGHPDKLCDQVSDAILDACLKDDPMYFWHKIITCSHDICTLYSGFYVHKCVLVGFVRSRVACETCAKTGLVMVFGEITTSAKVNYEEVVRNTLKQIGYDDAAKGIDYKNCTVMVEIEAQSPDIKQSVDSQAIEETGAGDQGIM